MKYYCSFNIQTKPPVCFFRAAAVTWKRRQQFFRYTVWVTIVTLLNVLNLTINVAN